MAGQCVSGQRGRWERVGYAPHAHGKAVKSCGRNFMPNDSRLIGHLFRILLRLRVLYAPQPAPGPDIRGCHAAVPQPASVTVQRAMHRRADVPKAELVTVKEEELRFKLLDSDISVANALRRVLLADVRAPRAPCRGCSRILAPIGARRGG